MLAVLTTYRLFCLPLLPPAFRRGEGLPRAMHDVSPFRFTFTPNRCLVGSYLRPFCCRRPVPSRPLVLYPFLPRHSRRVPRHPIRSPAPGIRGHFLCPPHPTISILSFPRRCPIASSFSFGFSVPKTIDGRLEKEIYLPCFSFLLALASFLIFHFSFPYFRLSLT